MPAIIDSSPGCVRSIAGVTKGDADDFILQAAYEKCAGFMTFGPGSTYGEEGAGANELYYVVTVIGIAFMLAVIVIWVVSEDRRLLGHVRRLRERGFDDARLQI